MIMRMKGRVIQRRLYGGSIFLSKVLKVVMSMGWQKGWIVGVEGIVVKKAESYWLKDGIMQRPQCTSPLDVYYTRI